MTDPTSTRTHPVLFIHGLWIHSSAWRPWQDLFEAKGYATSAPGWPGDGDTVQATRDDPDPLNEVGILDICEHYAALIEAMPVRPVVVGHSFGGLIAQELLANQYAAAAVAIDPAPIKGVKVLPFAQLRSGLPVLGNPANKKRTVSLTAKQFRYSFGNALTEAGVGRAARAVDHSRPGPTAVRGRHRQLQPRTPRPPSTRTTPYGVRCCSSPAPRTTPCRSRSPRPSSSSTPTTRRRPTTRWSRAAGTR